MQELLEGLIYLASPYSSTDDETKIKRFVHARDHTAFRLREGHSIYSPIVYSHQFHMIYGFSMGNEDWISFNNTMMDLSSACEVLCLPGWKESKGVDEEIKYFQALNKPIIYTCSYDNNFTHQQGDLFDGDNN